MSTSVCGIKGFDYERATNSQLKNLLNELGRNGETEQGNKIKEKITSILRMRKENGVKLEDGGCYSHRV